MTSSKKIDLSRDFAADVYQRVLTGDTVSYIGIFDPALWTVAPLTFSLVQLPPSPLLYVNKCTVYTYKVCKGGRGMGFCLRQMNTCRKVPLLVNFVR
jgi:hypothetical protein